MRRAPVIAFAHLALAVTPLVIANGCGRDQPGGRTEVSVPTKGAADNDSEVPSKTDTHSPEVVAAEPTILPVPTSGGLAPVIGFSVNARVQPHGLPASWHVEYGPTTAYGSQTPDRALPGKLDAHFAEDWAEGLNGWLAGMSGVQLTSHFSGGHKGGPYVRYSDDQGAGNDTNHIDGIGVIHLGPYAYLGNFHWAEVPPIYLGGGFPDLRGAKISVYLRGVNWVPNGTELGTWIQGYRDPSVVEVLPEDSRYPNWVFTGNPQTGRLVSGEWELAEWVLRNRTQDWTFAGANGGRLLYDYGELDSLLGGVNVDFFLLQILGVDLNHQPSGSFDSANLQVTFRQHSLCTSSNGGTLASAPAGGTGSEFLADGWRHGADREWQSQSHPVSPQTFVYAFDNPVKISSVNVHNAIRNPSKDLQVSVSEDNGTTWKVVAEGTLPEAHERGPNYAFFHVDAHVLVEGVAVWSPLHPHPVNRLKIEVLSGYQADHWGLGEIEAFGTGASEQTEDDWYDLNQDVRVEPGTWHYRISATTSAGTTTGPDQVVVVR